MWRGGYHLSLMLPTVAVISLYLGFLSLHFNSTSEYYSVWCRYRPSFPTLATLTFEVYTSLLYELQKTCFEIFALGLALTTFTFELSMDTNIILSTKKMFNHLL